MRLSILVATYNRSQYLLRTLRSLCSQTLANEFFEVVVVDNNSPDDTAQACEQFRSEAPFINFKYYFEARQGLSHARNSAIAQSSGDILVMIDDDEEVDPFLGQVYGEFFDAHPDVAAAGGKVVPLYEVEPPAWRTSYTDSFIASSLDLGDSRRDFRSSEYPIGANIAFRRRVIDQYGGFNPELGRKGNTPMGGEEKDFFMRLRAGGERIAYLPEAVIHHIIPSWKITDDYFDRLTYMIGVSERRRTKGIALSAFACRIASEAIKWCGAVALAFIYLLKGTPVKGLYLLKMRKNITRGLLTKEVV